MEEQEAVEAFEIEHHEMTHFAGVEPKFDMNSHNHGSFLSNFSVSSCVISQTRFARLFVYGLLVVTCLPLIAGAAFISIFIEDENYNACVVAFFTGKEYRLLNRVDRIPLCLVH
ncbi:uncharacterized protein CDAR_459611 [Caerostris darwini]|uniref:Uncharacterized protein n=1 Tax=Caerostris darwini TaxID=1538125 RepID=A0AAV4UUR6_9ARAC|nr:uncharacterized protein CDAR_459611 [Caerostris darwini]